MSMQFFPNYLWTTWLKTGPFKAARMTVKLDGDIIMGEIAATADKRYLNPAYGSLEDMG